MNETVKEWIAKAEGDFVTAGRELRARRKPNYDSACFHAQQGVEKLMKALLIHLGRVPPKTHDLVFLSAQLAPVCPQWAWPKDDLTFVSRAAVTFRYPGESATRKHATDALAKAKRMRSKLLVLLRTVGRGNKAQSRSRSENRR